MRKAPNIYDKSLPLCQGRKLIWRYLFNLGLVQIAAMVARLFNDPEPMPLSLFSHHLDQITIAELVGDVPSDRREY
jgi:hypothetical protein